MNFDTVGKWIGLISGILGILGAVIWLVARIQRDRTLNSRLAIELKRTGRGAGVLAIGALIVALVGLLVSAQSSGGLRLASANRASATIKVCTELPTSGADTSVENGVTLAIKQANENRAIPGYILVHAPFDDAGSAGAHDPDTDAKNMRSAIGDALVAGCIGPLDSGAAQSEMPIANKAPLALISPANVDEALTKPEDGRLTTLRPTGKVTYFRVSTTDDLQGPAGADYFYTITHVRKAYVIDDTGASGKSAADSFVKEFEQLGGSVVGRKSLDTNTRDYKPTIAEAVALGAQGIYYGGAASSDGVTLNGGALCRVQMMTVMGADNLLFGGDNDLLTDFFKNTTLKANAAGAVATVASVNADRLASAAQFKADFAKEFPDPAAYGAYSANAYDATNILIQAIRKALFAGAVNPADSADAAGAKTFRQAVIDQIAGINYNGVTGHTTFDRNGDTTNRIISVYQLGASDWEFVTQFSV
jgi:branched-chain amino acid transport system substrate-binding protein